MAHQSTAVLSFIFLIYILVTLVQRCCSDSPLSLSSAVAAMLLFPPLLNSILININTFFSCAKTFI